MITSADRQLIFNDIKDRLISDGLYIVSAQNKVKYFRNQFSVNISASPTQTSGDYSALEIIIDDFIAGITDYYSTSAIAVSAFGFTFVDPVSASGRSIGLKYDITNLTLNAAGQLTTIQDISPNSTLILNGLILSGFGSGLLSAVNGTLVVVEGGPIGDHGLLIGLSDDDHQQYIYSSPSSNIRNLITSQGDIKSLSLVGSPTQTVNLFEIKNNADDVLFSVSAQGTVQIAGDLIVSGESRNLYFSNGSSHDISTQGHLRLYTFYMTLETTTNGITMKPQGTDTVYVYPGSVSAVNTFVIEQNVARVVYLSGANDRLVMTDSTGMLKNSGISASYVPILIDVSNFPAIGTAQKYAKFSGSRGIYNGTLADFWSGSEVTGLSFSIPYFGPASLVFENTDGSLGSAIRLYLRTHGISNHAVATTFYQLGPTGQPGWETGTDYNTSAYFISYNPDNSNNPNNKFFTVDTSGHAQIGRALPINSAFLNLNYTTAVASLSAGWIVLDHGGVVLRGNATKYGFLQGTGNDEWSLGYKSNLDNTTEVRIIKWNASNEVVMVGLSGTGERYVTVDATGTLRAVSGSINAVSATASGTVDRLAKFVTSASLGDSIISELGSLIYIDGSLKVGSLTGLLSGAAGTVVIAPTLPISVGGTNNTSFNGAYFVWYNGGSLVSSPFTSASFLLSANGTVNYIPKFATSNSLTNSLIVDDGTAITANANVQIGGLTSPSTTLNIDGTSGTLKQIIFKSLGRNRWVIRSGAQTEISGTNQGSWFQIIARDDAGNTLDNPVEIDRQGSGAIYLARSTILSQSLNVSGATRLSTNLYFGSGSQSVAAAQAYTTSALGLIFIGHQGSSSNFLFINNGSAGQSVLDNPVGTINTRIYGDLVLTGASKNIVFTETGTSHAVSAKGFLNVLSEYSMTIETSTDYIYFKPSSSNILTLTSLSISAFGVYDITSSRFRASYLSGVSDRLTYADAFGTLKASTLITSAIAQLGTGQGAAGYYAVFSNSTSIVRGLLKEQSESGLQLAVEAGLSNVYLDISNTSTANNSQALLYLQTASSTGNSRASIFLGTAGGSSWALTQYASSSGFAISYSNTDYFRLNTYGQARFENGLTLLGDLSATGTINFNSLSGTASRQLGVDSAGNLIIVGAVSASISGTAGVIPKFATSVSLGNSIISELGSIITVGGDLILSESRANSPTFYAATTDEPVSKGELGGGIEFGLQTRRSMIRSIVLTDISAAAVSGTETWSASPRVGMVFYVQTAGTGQQEVFRITDTKRVIVGKVSDTGQQLQVAGSTQLESTLVVSGASTFNSRILGNFTFNLSGSANILGPVGIGGTINTSYGLLVTNGNLQGTTQIGIGSLAVGSTAATVRVIGIDSQIKTAAFATPASVYALYAENPSLGASSSVLSGYGLWIESQTAATTNHAIYTGLGLVRFGDAVGIGESPSQAFLHINSVTDSSNVRLRVTMPSGTNSNSPFSTGILVESRDNDYSNYLVRVTKTAGSVNSTNGRYLRIDNGSTILFDVGVYGVGIGASYNTSYGLNIASTNLQGIYQYALVSTPTFTSAATAYGIGGYFQGITAPNTNMSNGVGIYIDDFIKGGGSPNTISTQVGLFVAGQSKGSVDNYAIYTNAGQIRFGDKVFANSTLNVSGSIMISDATGVYSVFSSTPRSLISRSGNSLIVGDANAWTSITNQIQSGNFVWTIGSSPTTYLTLNNVGMILNDNLNVSGSTKFGSNVTFIAAATFQGDVALFSSTANQVIFADASNVMKSSSNLTFDGTRFGIGTTPSTYQFRIKTSGVSSQNIVGITNNSDSLVLEMKTGTDGHGSLNLRTSAAAVQIDLHAVGTSTISDVLTLGSALNVSGSVGIKSNISLVGGMTVGYDVGTSADSGIGINIVKKNLGVSTQYAAPGQVGLYSQCTFTAAASAGYVIGIDAGVHLPSLEFNTYTLAAGIWIDPIDGSSNTINDAIGLYIEGQTDGVRNYSIYTGAGIVRFGDTILVQGSSSSLLFQNSELFPNYVHHVSADVALNVFAGDTMTLQTTTNSIVFRPGNTTAVIMTSNSLSAIGNFVLTNTAARLNHLAGGGVNRLMYSDSFGNINSSTVLSADYVIVSMDSASRPSPGTADYYAKFSQGRGVANGNLRENSAGLLFSRPDAASLTVFELQNNAAASPLSQVTSLISNLGAGSHVFAQTEYSIGQNINWSVGTLYSTSAFYIASGSDVEKTARFVIMPGGETYFKNRIFATVGSAPDPGLPYMMVLRNSGNSTYISLDKDSTSYECGITFKDNNVSRWHFYMDDVSSNYLQLIATDVSPGSETDNDPRLRFAQGSKNSWIGGSGGSVGINHTRSLSYNFHVFGTSLLEGNVFVSGNGDTENLGTASFTGNNIQFYKPFYQRDTFILHSDARADVNLTTDTSVDVVGKSRLSVTANPSPGHTLTLSNPTDGQILWIYNKTTENVTIPNLVSSFINPLKTVLLVYDSPTSLWWNTGFSE